MKIPANYFILSADLKDLLNKQFKKKTSWLNKNMRSLSLLSFDTFLSPKLSLYNYKKNKKE